MSANLNSQTLRDIYATTTEEAFLLLVTVTHETLDAPFRIVNNTEPVTSRGEVFIPFWFEFAFPDQSAERQAEMQFVLDNVALPLVEPLRAITTPAHMLVQLIAASRPDEILAEETDLALRNVTWDANAMTFTAAHEDVMNARFPGNVFSPAHYAGVF